MANADPLSLDLYNPKFQIALQDRIACAGSCFAQHISKQLRARKFNVLDKEPSPRGLSPENALRYGYATFSARYANIYVVRQLLQLAREAFSQEKRSLAEIVWKKGDRYFDALRPSIEPEGHASAEEVVSHREIHLQRVRELFSEMNVFIFTLGLTECWENIQTGLVYPTCPGTIAGTFDPAVFRFKNLGFHETYNDFVAFKTLIDTINPGVRFLLTVSPVPLTATATSTHVLSATTYSKSVLRAVAGELSAQFPEIDYFPSYEIITGPQSKGRFYEPNLRSITPAGVAIVMKGFFSRQNPAPADADPQPDPAVKRSRTDDDIACEEAMLEAFSKK